MVEKLAENKGDQVKDAVNIQNEQGNTPLHWGALNGHLAVVEILVKNGADCKVKLMIERIVYHCFNTKVDVDQEQDGQDSYL